MHFTDSVVAFFNPGAALRRVVAREALSKRAYEGASNKDGWRPRRAGASANTDHAQDATSLRNRARSLAQNVPYIAQGLNSLVANTVGTGIVPRSLDPRQGDRIDALWAEWSKTADADGRLDLYGLQAAAYRAMEQDGECLIRIRPRRVEDGLPVPLQVQLLEIDWLDSLKSETINGNIIVNGIEYDSIGRVSAYWLYDAHPGETTTLRTTTRLSRRVPAESIIHLYNPQRPGQGRGITRLAPIIARVRDLMTYEDAELSRKNLESRLSVLASGDPAAMGSLNPEDTRTEAQIRADGNLGALGGGSIIQVPSGLNLTVVEPKATPGYVDYVKYQLHLIAAGMGITYEMLTGDVREVNFSSARVALLEFRRNAESVQWLCLVPRLCERLWTEFVSYAIDAGKLPATIDRRVDWSTPKWEYVNPEQDVKAELLQIAGGLTSISEVLRRRGYKPDLVFAEIKSDLDRLESDGTLDTLLAMQGKTRTTPAQQAAAQQASARAKERDAELTARLEALRSLHAEHKKAATEQAARLQTLAETAMQQSAAHAARAEDEIRQLAGEVQRQISAVQAVADVTNANTTQTLRDVQSEMQHLCADVRSNADQVNAVIEAISRRPPDTVTVHMAPTDVHNHVAPATVQVDVTARLPERTTTTKLTRDQAGQIVGSVTTEVDAA